MNDIKVSVSSDGRISAKIPITHPSPELALAVGRVLAEVHRIETQTGRRPTAAVVGPDDLAGFSEITYDGIQIRTAPFAEAGDIYLLVSQK